jgi:hypothetical protein
MVSMMGDRSLVVSATLRDRESVAGLIHMLGMVKEYPPLRASDPEKDGASTKIPIHGSKLSQEPSK